MYTTSPLKHTKMGVFTTLSFLALSLTLITVGCWKEPRSTEQRVSDAGESTTGESPRTTGSGGKDSAHGSTTPDAQPERQPSARDKIPHGSRKSGNGQASRSGGASSDSASLSAEQIYQQIKPSLVLITARTVSEDKLGSGFIVGQNMVVTNRHIITKSEKVQVRRVVGLDERPSVVQSTVQHPSVDLAILSANLDGPGLSLGKFDQVDVGETVFVAGNPKGLEATFSKGIVSGIRSRNGNTVLQITAPVSKGSSGGPVFNREGEVIGVVFAVQPNGQNLNFAVPVIYVRKTLHRVR